MILQRWSGGPGLFPGRGGASLLQMKTITIKAASVKPAVFRLCRPA
jgi:hypothetical protein